jgi:hypothetical protein
LGSDWVRLLAQGEYVFASGVALFPREELLIEEAIARIVHRRQGRVKAKKETYDHAAFHHMCARSSRDRAANWAKLAGFWPNS